MSTHESPCQLSSSVDCPLDDGQRAIQRVTARAAEIGGGIGVSRLLPSPQRRMIGAWCFLDHAGPATFAAGAGAGLRIGPHPHIGLQTFTWMIAGEVLHRDSLGHVQVVRPGQVNLMTAGRGISHSEETLPAEQQLHAAQLWIALPGPERQREPAFEHHPDLPGWQQDGCRLTLLAGQYGDQRAPARVHSPLLGIDLHSPQGASLELALEPAFEYGVLPLQGSVEIQAERFEVNQLAYLGRGRERLALQLEPGSRALLLGGEPFAEEILLWWNFVGHSRAELAQAQRDWAAGHPRFGRVEGYDGAPLVAPALPWADD
ncbi:pirin family protein [Pseudomonas lalucatii]|uniref:Pirin family protein n=1 Tax=Pseudomonas lalucatii TaxID=1424203 RepID=A0ABS5PYY7_9PSED|nr:pirin family protein [Pseudomonas lalucatii]MBS7661690.1 pirin family protein [Pseudomonas lalucatii]MBS7723905.1 pirin family protein [Pseudomonas lalucatii]QVM88091.1 pirin family protein [Pseudomonas lalucatii]